MKKQINPFDYASVILNAVSKGLLVTSSANGFTNIMTIGWGTMGVEWRVPIFIIFIREHRYTRILLDTNPEFSLNVPMENFDRKILGIAGIKSGRNVDKISLLGLHLEEPDKISVPSVREAPLTLECKIIYRQLQDKNAIPDAFVSSFYPQDLDSSHSGGNKDFHIAYYGQIVSSYIIQ